MNNSDLTAHTQCPLDDLPDDLLAGAIELLRFLHAVRRPLPVTNASASAPYFRALYDAGLVTLEPEWCCGSLIWLAGVR